MTDAPDHVVRRRGWVAIVAALLVLAVLWALHVAMAGDVAGLFHDEGEYLVTARALARGVGYRVTSLPGAPAEVHYPPLFPLLLAPVWALAPAFPGNLLALKAVPLVSAVGLVLLLPRYLRAIGLSPLAAGIAAVLTALAPLTLRYATAVVSELPFMLLLTAALLAVEQAADRRRPASGATLAGALAGLATLVRVVGVAAIAAGALELWRRGERRRAGAFVATAGAVVLPWVAWLVTRPGGGLAHGYVGELRQGGVARVGELLGHVAQLPAAVAVVALPGVSDVLPADAPTVVAVVLYAVGVVMLVAAVRSRAGACVALSLALAVAWPMFQPRYVLPVAPLLLGTLLGRVVPPDAGTRRRRGALAVALLLGLLSFAGQRAALARVRASGFPDVEQLPDTAVTWADVDTALTWLRDSTRPHDVLGGVHDPLLALYTDRSAVRAYPALRRAAPEQVDGVLAAGRVGYLVDLPCPRAGAWADARRAWRAWLRAHRRALTPVYVGAHGRVRIWRVPPTLLAAGRDG
jgi:4-amino-4-deoxy-L-arabinose transferase-like glycosyltransferase